MASPSKRADPLSSSSSLGRPASPSPSRSFRNRMSTAVRRASTGLAFSQVGKLSRSSSKASLKVDPVQASASSEDVHIAPSPVAESPAREAAASAEPPVPLGPSPLANVASAESVASSPAPVPAPLPESEPAQVTASPEQVPIALSPQAPAASSEPFGFSDPVVTTSPDPIVTSPPLPVQDAPAPVPAPAPAPAPAEPEPEVRLPEPSPQLPLPPPSTEPPVPSATEDRRADYFSYSDPISTVVAAEEPVIQPVQPEPQVSTPPLEPVPIHETSQPGGFTHVQMPTEASTFAWSDQPALGHKASRSSFSEPVQHSVEPTQSGKVSSRASKSSMSSSYGQLLPEQQKRGRSGSVRFSIDDPFADHFAVAPAMTMPKSTLSPVESVTMPEPITMPQPDAEPILDTDEHGARIHDSPTPMRFPLPPLQDVIGSQANHHASASAYSLGDRGDGSSLLDERIPLLQGSAKTTPSRGKTTNVIATFSSGPITTEIAASRTLQTLGWTEHTLPDSTQYYHHVGMRVTTDVDLRNPRYLQRITEFLEKTVSRETSLPAAQGWELWVRNSANLKPEFKPEQSWVNHAMRAVTNVPPPTILGNGLIMENFNEDTKLDMEYRYWCFVEGHPAHVPLPTESHTEAMDALKWSYTDSLIPTAQSAPLPFAPQECQELMNLLRSFDETSNSALIVQTRVVARVLLRISQWRQVQFRPDKPLPRDAIKGVKETRTSLGRTVVDFIIGCFCLGIPYIFLSRSRYSFDEESGLYSAGPMLMVSACACLVAAVILSASVTFLSLPQLDDVPRLAGFLAIAFSASSMASAVIALFRYKAEIDRTIVYLGGEGLMVLSRRSVIFSLPLVFLAWAIAAFMTGITLYSFRGATVTSRVAVTHPFEPYTHWTVVGTLGALGGVLTVAALVARR